MVVTFARAFSINSIPLKKTMTMVSAIDVDLSLSNYAILTKDLEGLDHYFILDKNSKNVIMHSKAPYILREGISIT
jgi:hypothetical protein